MDNPVVYEQVMDPNLIYYTFIFIVGSIATCWCIAIAKARGLEYLFQRVTCLFGFHQYTKFTNEHGQWNIKQFRCNKPDCGAKIKR